MGDRKEPGVLPYVFVEALAAVYRHTTGVKPGAGDGSFAKFVCAVLDALGREMARRFLAGLDPNATRFTFQLFSDCGAGRYAEIFHGTLDEVWPKVLALNTPQQVVGVFVTINETDFQGRSAKTSCGRAPSLSMQMARSRQSSA